MTATESVNKDRVIAETDHTVTLEKVVKVNVKETNPDGTPGKTRVETGTFTATFPKDMEGVLELFSKEGNASNNGKTLTKRKNEDDPKSEQVPMSWADFYLERIVYGIDGYFRAPVSNAIRNKFGNNEPKILKKIEDLQAKRIENGRKPLSDARARHIVMVAMGLIDEDEE
jgi:hypothetical protein